MTDSPAEMAGKVIHDVVALFLLVILIVVMFYPTDATKNTLSLTSTFLSTYYSNAPSLTWTPPALDPPVKAELATTYYGCLFQAQVGFAAPVSCGRASKSDFPNCINAATSTFTYYQKATVSRLQRVLADYTGDGYDLSTLPSAFTGDLTKVTADLTVPGLREELIKKLLFLDTAVAKDIVRVVTDTRRQSGIEGCVASAQQDPAIRHEITPVFDELWRCTASVIPTTTEEARQAYDQCVPLSAWPILDVLQTPYSGSFLGSYNKYFVLFVGTWILLSFVVYTAWLGVDSAADARGKPNDWLARNGKVLAITSLVWNIVGMIFVLAAGFQESKDNYVMTIQTVFLTGGFGILSVVYFAREVYEHFVPAAEAGHQERLVNRGDPMDTSDDLTPNTANSCFRLTPMGYFMRYKGIQHSQPISLDHYTPLLVFAWSDCWMFCDALLLLGIVGTSADVVTADLVRVFLTLGYTTVLHGALTRLLYEGYVNDDGDGKKGLPYATLSANLKTTYGLRVMSFLLHIALMVLGFVNWYLILGRYSPGGGTHGLIIAYLILNHLLPTVAWFIYTFLLEFNAVGYFTLTAFAQTMFILGAFMRGLFILIAMIMSTQFADANFSGTTSLQRMLTLINS